MRERRDRQRRQTGERDESGEKEREREISDMKN